LHHPHRLGAYIYGGVGTGKTLVMDHIFALAPQPKCRTHMHALRQEWLQQLNALQDSNTTEPPHAALARRYAERARLLCWDEIEITEIADAMMFGRILGELSRYPVTVIMTSNRPPHQLYQGLHADMFEPTVQRIKDAMQCLALDRGHDYRQNAKTLKVHSRYTMSEEDRCAMWDHFRQLTHPMVAQPQHYTLPGRRLTLSRVAGATAWASFDELCAMSLSTLDYGVLAEHVHTLFIQDVPALVSCPRDQIRRWIWLIDILYDRKVKVVLGLQAPLANPGGDSQFEVDRTLSRLQEMQYWLSQRL